MIRYLPHLTIIIILTVWAVATAVNLPLGV